MLADHATAHPTVSGSGRLPYQVTNAGRLTGEHLFGLRYAEAVCPGVAALRDYNFKRPAQGLEAVIRAPRDTTLEV